MIKRNASDSMGMDEEFFAQDSNNEIMLHDSFRAKKHWSEVFMPMGSSESMGEEWDAPVSLEGGRKVA